MSLDVLGAEAPTMKTVPGSSDRAARVRSGQVGAMVAVPGYDAGRMYRPKETKVGRGGEVESLRKEHHVSREVVDRFKTDLEGDLLQLLDARNDQTAEEFRRFVTESGHGYYLPLFQQCVKEVPGTNGRQYGIDQKALMQFIWTNKGLATVVEIKRRKLAEQLMADAADAALNPNEPSNRMLQEERGSRWGGMRGGGLKPDTRTLTEGGPLREMAKRVWEWGGERTGTPDGRERPSLRIRKGAVSLVIGGTTIALGVGATAVASPLVGALVAAGGLAAQLGGVGIADLFRHGVDQDIDISGAALRSVLGDPNSPTMPGPNTAQIEWSRRMNHMDPTDYQVTARGASIRTDRVSQTTKNRVDRRNDIQGHLRDIELFEKDNGIAAEYRRSTSHSWLYQESVATLDQLRPPQDSTPFSAAVMQEFNVNRGGIQDINGHSIERRVTHPITGAVVLDARGREIWEPNAATVVSRDWTTGAPVNPPAFITNPDVDVVVDPMTGIPVYPPQYQPGREPFDRTQLDMVGNVQRWQEASERVLKRWATDVLTDIADGGHQYDDELATTIATAREALRDPKKREQLREGIAERIQLLTGDQESLRDQQTGTEEFQTQVFELHRIIAKQNRELEESVAQARVEVIGGSGKSRRTAAETIDALQRALGAGGVPGEMVSVNGEVIQSIDADEEALEVRKSEYLRDYARVHVSPISTQIPPAELRLGSAEAQLVSVQGILAVGREAEARKAQQVAVAQQKVAQERQLLANLMQREQRAQDLFAQQEGRLSEMREFQQAAARIERRKKLLEDALSGIQAKGHAVYEAEEALRSDDVPGRLATAEFLLGLPKARETVEGWTGIGITTLDLQTQTLDQLLGRINASYPADSDAWPAGENQDGERRMLILKAIVEAKASREIEAPVPLAVVMQTAGISDSDILSIDTIADADIQTRIGGTPPPSLGAIKRARTALVGRVRLDELLDSGVSEVDIHALSSNELHIQSSSVSVEQMDAVKAEASRRLLLRQKANKQLITRIGTLRTEEEERMESFQEHGIETPQLDVADIISKRYGDIYDRIMNDIHGDDANRGELGTFLSLESAQVVHDAGRATYTEEERKYTVAELNILDALTGYRNNPTARYEENGVVYTGIDAALRQTLSVVNFNQIRDVFIQEFNLRMGRRGGRPALLQEAIGLLLHRFDISGAILPATVQTASASVNKDLSFEDDRVRIARALSEGFIYGPLKQQVATLV